MINCFQNFAFNCNLRHYTEVKLGVGGTSYAEFIESVNLPKQLAAVVGRCRLTLL